jgi:hypothetical protein
MLASGRCTPDDGESGIVTAVWTGARALTHATGHTGPRWKGKFAEAHHAPLSYARHRATTVMWITGLLMSRRCRHLLGTNRASRLSTSRSELIGNWELEPMSKEAEYRSLAALCLEFATRTNETANKARLLAKAEAWLDLADRVSRLAKRSAGRIADHP